MGAPFRFILMVLALSALASGCVRSFGTFELDRLSTSARYSEVEEKMEAKIKDLSSASTWDLWYLCHAYSKLKKYNELFPCLDQMEKNITEGDRRMYWFDMSEYPHTLRGEAYLDLGEYGKAIEEGLKAQKIAKKKIHPVNRVHALGGLALAYALDGDRSHAEQYLKSLKGVYVGYPYTMMRPEKMIAIAKVYMALGQFDKALSTISNRSLEHEFFKFTSDFSDTVFTAGTSRWTTWLELPQNFIHGKCLYETGQVEKAKRGYDNLLKHPATEFNGEIFWMILFDRGRIAEKEGKLDEAVAFYEKAVGVIEAQRSTINTEASKIGYVGNKQAVYHHLIAALFRQERHGKAFEYVERSKSRALVDLLASKQQFAIRSGDREEIAAILKKLETLEYEGKIQETDESLEQISQRRSGNLETASRLRSKAPEMASLVTVTGVSAEAIQSRIAPDETLVAYYYSEDELYVFLLTRTELKARKLEGQNLQGDILGFRASLEDPGSDGYVSWARKLYERLIRPLERDLANPHLIVIPHGILHYLPFNALKDGENYLIDRYSIRFLPSASVMEYFRESRSGVQEKLMAVGNPELGERKAPLTHAEEEAKAIAQSFPDSTLLLREDATETVFKKVGASFDLIHLATHGFFEAEHPLNSGLFLTADQENDGFLAVDELYSLELGSDLVTLSACETGLSKVSNGDELVGLARGFLYAGASAIVASLWSVDDEATSYLMQKFYANLAKTSKRDALRLAQLETRKKHPHPFYWAAFQLTGSA
jgi:CHAT domain-containing protein